MDLINYESYNILSQDDPKGKIPSVSGGGAEAGSGGGCQHGGGLAQAQLLME